MIYLDNIQDAQTLFVPRVYTGEHGSLSLLIKNTTGLEQRIEDVIDLETSVLYYNLSLALPEGMESGEYEYVLLDGSIELTSGVLVIKDDSLSVSEYEKPIEYEQY